MATVEQRTGDLLDQRDVEVIVNAWNRNFIPWWLLLPQGVSGAIKRRGGFAPFIEVGRAGWLKAGDAAFTSAGRLPYQGIIHVAALTAWWTSSEVIIRRCAKSALDIAAKRAIGSVGFPLIGSGTGGVNPKIALKAIKEEAEMHAYNGRVVIVEYVT